MWQWWYDLINLNYQTYQHDQGRDLSVYIQQQKPMYTHINGQSPFDNCTCTVLFISFRFMDQCCSYIKERSLYSTESLEWIIKFEIIHQKCNENYG